MLVDQLLRQSRLRPRQTAVTDPVSSLTYRNLTNLAVVMRKLVLRESRSDTVGILLPSGGAFAGALFGTLWAGKVAVPLNFLLSSEELAEIVKDAALDIVISVHHFDKLTSQLGVRTICLEDLPIKRGVFTAGLRRWPAEPDVHPDDLAVLLYTSGTSGAPKGVELSFKNLRSNCDAIIEAVGLRDSDRFLCVLPPFHVFGLTANVLVPVLRGLVVRAIPRFNPAAVFRALKEFEPTVLMAIPSMYTALLRNKSVASDAFAGFHLLVSGGEPLPEVVAKSFRERFSVDLLEGYGLTETSPVISINFPEQYRRGTVGKPLKNVCVRILTEDGKTADSEEEGEILVRGPSVMRGYHKRPEETSAAIDDDGWFATGDIGKLDSDGFLHITGRKKEMIIVGGENVFPGEIENALSRHPAVEEAAVIGMSDPSRGEVPLAFVILGGSESVTAAELRSFVKQYLAGHKVPREIRIVEDLPRGPTGKVAKRQLKETTGATRREARGC